MKDFAGKIIVISGGSRGIGAAVATEFAKLGARIAITYRSNKRQAETCLREIRASGSECIALQAEVSNAKAVRNAVRKVLAHYGRIDVLVNNAGVWRRGEIGKMTEKQWDETIEINLKGTFLFCNEVVPIMKRQGGGKIINISSTAGQRGEPYYSHYAASKGGVISFTKSIAAELAPFNINVNSVSPGWVDTDMTEHVLHNPSIRPGIDSAIPRGRVATPSEIAGTVLFLASEMSVHIVGATINVNGGSVLF